MVIFDHEMAFSFLYALIQDEYPWHGKGIEYAKDHIFFDGLKGKQLSWHRLQGALEAVDDNRLTMYVDAVPDDWRKESNDATGRIREYLRKAIKNINPLFESIQEVLL